jgi:hypothetical protein
VEEKHRINAVEQHVWFFADQHVWFREVDDKFSAWIAIFAIPLNSHFIVNKKNAAILREISLILSHIALGVASL